MFTYRRMPAQHGRARHLVVTAALLLEALLLTACAGSAEPEEVAVDRGRLTNQIKAYLDVSASFDGVRAVVVRAAAGEPVVEIYRGTDSETYWDVESATKSVVSILVGIALDEGLLDDLDQTLAELLPAHAAQMSPHVADATLGQVLTMRAGFSGFFDEQNVYIDRTAQYMGAADPVGRILRTASADRAGVFDYSNGGAQLVSAILREATGMSVLDYARSRLFEPLGISSEPAYQPVGVGIRADAPADALWAMSAAYVKAYLNAGFAWPVDRAGNHLGWCFLKLTPTDLAKIGLLMANHGRWEGRQIVSEEWVQRSTRSQVAVDQEASVGTGGTGYGYFWWEGAADGERAFFAAGYGGQLIEVVPTKALVVAISTEYDLNNPTSFDLAPKNLVQLVDDVIAPAFANEG